MAVTDSALHPCTFLFVVDVERARPRPCLHQAAGPHARLQRPRRPQAVEVHCRELLCVAASWRSFVGCRHAADSSLSSRLQVTLFTASSIDLQCWLLHDLNADHLCSFGPLQRKSLKTLSLRSFSAPRPSTRVARRSASTVSAGLAGFAEDDVKADVLVFTLAARRRSRGRGRHHHLQALREDIGECCIDSLYTSELRPRPTQTSRESEHLHPSEASIAWGFTD